MKIKNGEFWLGDCLELMQKIPDKSVDMILCDLPYGTTACSWDTIIPFEPLWKQYWRIAKPNAAIVLTCCEPFSTRLRISNFEYYKYDWYWLKNRPNGWQHSKNKPMRKIENIAVFSKSTVSHDLNRRMNYNPQGISDAGEGIVTASKHGKILGDRKNQIGKIYKSKTGFPTDILEFSKDEDSIHPTQKPVALFEYLIKTYTNEGETVLDNCAGSGTTAIAAENTNRRWVCIEKDPAYYYGAVARVLT